MRICLLHNEHAGDAVSVSFLRSAIEKAGHTLAHAVESDSDLERVLQEPIDLLVASGGDGTVRRAATALAGRDLPLAILPLGTANNIARSLGIKGTISRVIAGWEPGHRKLVDLGVARGPWGEIHFVEGIGCGLVPAGIRGFKADPGTKDDLQTILTQAAWKYLDVLSQLEPRHISLSGDVQMEHECLLFEVLNIASVGPNLVLADHTNPSDGAFTVVIAGEEHRDALADYLRCRGEQRDCGITLPSWDARELVMDGCNEVHVDDAVHRWPAPRPVSISMGTAAVTVLTGGD